MSRTWALLALLAACGGPGQSALDDPGTPEPVVAAQRVIALFEDRHVDGGKLDEARSAQIFELVLEAVDPAQQCTTHRSTLVSFAGGLGGELQRGDFGFARRAAQRCTGKDLSAVAARSVMLDALARSYDPHSAYLATAGDAAEHTAPTGPLPPEALARGRVIEHASHRIGHVVLPSFYLLANGRSAAGDLTHIIEQLVADGMETLLLDLRGNGGGVVSQAVDVLAVLAGPAPLGHVSDASGEVETLGKPDATPLWKGPQVVWVDAGTASVAELVAAALQDTGTGLVIGERTHGKGTSQSLVWLASPLGAKTGAVRISTGRMFRVDGRGIQRQGVTPDVVLKARASGIDTERHRAGALRNTTIRVAKVTTSSAASANLGNLTRAATGLDGLDAALSICVARSGASESHHHAPN